MNPYKISKIAKSMCILLSAASLVGTVNFVNKKITEDAMMKQIEECREIHHYILHSGTKRIHIDSCESENRMSDKNRVEVDDSIYNLVNKGYFVCGNCNAGIKGKNAFIESSKLNGMDIMNYDVGKLPSYYEYVNSIENMGRWYATHVSTYRANFQTETLYNNDCYIKEYDIGQEVDSVVVDKSTEGAIFSTASELEVQRASKDAIEFYLLNKNKISYKPFAFMKKTAYYPCELLANSKDDYKMAGDDCVRFFFSFVNSIKNDFTYHLKQMSKTNWSKISTADLISNESDILYSMHRLGYEIYDTKEIKIFIDDDNIEEYTTRKIDESFNLKKGDLILRDNHLHVYLGNGINPAENYGWGRVYREYPRIYNFTKKYNGGYYFIINEEKDEDLKYTRVYRYVGKEK